jgi:hypothetical protein
MTDPRVHAELAEPLEERFGMPLNDVEEQLYDSFVLLTDPEFSDETDVGLTEDDLAALLALPGLQEWLEPKL